MGAVGSSKVFITRKGITFQKTLILNRNRMI